MMSVKCYQYRHCVCSRNIFDKFCCFEQCCWL